MERMTIMEMDKPVMKITIDGVNIHSEILDYPVDTIGLWLLLPERITLKTFDTWLRKRLPDPTRADIDLILKKYDVPDFLPYQMCKKSHGIRIQDFYWIKWDGERVTYNDIRIR